MKTRAYPEYDLQKSANSKLFVGLWRLMKGYQWHYIGATLTLGISAASRTGIYLLLGYYVDEVLKKAKFDSTLILAAVAFLLLVFSQAINVVPDPPNISNTIFSVLVKSFIIFANKRIGFGHECCSLIPSSASSKKAVLTSYVSDIT